MPDRITNTINVVDGQQFRPTAINCYPGTFSSFQDWWTKWQTFMFSTELSIEKKGSVLSLTAAQMLQPIKKAKYPALSLEEEAISLPLQTLSVAIFDSILVHMLNELTPDGEWQRLRHQVCDALNSKKNARILAILEEQYAHADVICLSEVANAFVATAQEVPALHSKFSIVSPQGAGMRDQNSVLLLSKEVFQSDSIVEVDVTSRFPQDTKVPVANGDILCVEVADLEGKQFLVCSFHGDTNGLATIPVLKAVHAHAEETKRTLIFGLDANTYEHGIEGKNQGIKEFAEFYVSLGLTSTWGGELE